MQADVKERWVKALRSGKYKQGKSELHSVESNSYCCLGVLCKIENVPEDEDGLFKFDHDESYIQLGRYYLYKIDLSESEQQKLIILNDTDSLSFEKIADYIEKNL